MRGLRVILRPFAAVAGLALFAACSGNGSHSASGGAGTVTIGIDLPLSGADASTGIPTQNGAVLAIEQANKRGLPGKFQLAYSSLDDAVQGVHDPAQGAQNIKTFIADASVLAVLGPYNSNVAKAEIPLTNDAGLAQISPATTSTALTKGPDAARLRTTHPGTIAYFRDCATDDRQGAAVARVAHGIGLRRVFVVDDDETYGTGLATVFVDEFTRLGGTVLGHEHLTRGQQDFKALLTKAQSAHPDFIFFAGTTASGGGLLRRQMGDAGMQAVPFFGGDGIGDAEFLHSAGAMANGTYYTVAAPNTERLPAAKAFLAAYQERFKSPIGPYSATAYAAAEIAIAAIEKAIAANGNKMPDRAAVLANVTATKQFPSPVGPITFNKDGDTTSPILSVYEVRNGQPVFINQIDVTK
jgi:branched-chain amino acid transport system substrate-binding protein